MESERSIGPATLAQELRQEALSAADASQLWPSVAMRLTKFFGCERATLFERTRKDELVSRHADGLAAPLRLPMGEGIAGWAAQTGQPYLSNDPYQDPRFWRSADHAARFRTRNLLAVPLLDRGKVVGVLELINKSGGFSSGDLSAAREIAAEVALVFAKTRAEEGRDELERKLIQAEKMAALGRLSGAFAHEVNNPLMAVLGFVEALMRSPGVSEEALKILLKVDSEIRRIRYIALDLLGFARPATGMRMPISLESVADDCLALLAPEARHRNVRLEKAARPDAPQALANRDQLKQVTLNLLLNAMQALEPVGGGSVAVRIFSPTPGRCCLEVADDGPGVPPQARERIFEPFFTTKGEKGTGLGLSVSLGLVQSQDGRLTLEPCRVGACFRVDLPAATPPDARS